ncbi:MAG: glycosyltransferase family 4 protein [Gloeomargaritaceae cyanobacterium C42_A2020_066]|nr:glycosyltransferase family 4 protein [Gloeomargaritaceae cyanobacterium C42_A2020_066]
MQQLAIISSHPIQYYAPWFRFLARETNLDIKVFYLWDFGVKEKKDPGFDQSVKWDIPLLEAYPYTFVRNASSTPGTASFWGLQNPSLIQEVSAYAPHAVLLMNYSYASLQSFIWRWPVNRIPLLFRGDSHRLLPAPGRFAALKRYALAQVFRRFRACLYVGKANYDYFRFHGVPPENLFFSPHAVDNERYFQAEAEAGREAQEWRRSLGVPEDHLVILYAAKFTDRKRPQDLIQAFIQAQLLGVSLLMVGAGPLEADLRTQAAGRPEIVFAPFQNQSQMPRVYAAGDVFVMPSYGPRETWGLAINEAQCMGRPVIVSSHVGCAADLVTPGETGWIFPAGDVSALAACLREACHDRARLQRLGAAGRERVQTYSYAQTTAGLLAALDDVLNRKG